MGLGSHILHLVAISIISFVPGGENRQSFWGHDTSFANFSVNGNRKLRLRREESFFPSAWPRAGERTIIRLVASRRFWAIRFALAYRRRHNLIG
jgi:hypothetical protein